MCSDKGKHKKGIRRKIIPMNIRHVDAQWKLFKLEWDANVNFVVNNLANMTATIFLKSFKPYTSNVHRTTQVWIFFKNKFCSLWEIRMELKSIVYSE